nr:cytosine permease [Dickeya chrysanthemi]
TSRAQLDESRRRGELPDAGSTPYVGWSAIIASLAGSGVGLYTNCGVLALNSLLAASLLYWFIRVMRPIARGV